ncbi:MAG: aminoacetone oxidase family FAD-binding enzyme [Planctomycetes bacterium]|nr:aminoacetone oxidase family FAD-binding enzyme [Planctomycetota bacterium]
MDSSLDMVVVGAGPAGQMAAIAAAERHLRVIVVEQMPRPSLKLIASGGGRANLTRTAGRADFEAAFGRQGRFIGPALGGLGPEALRAFLAHLGVPTRADEQGRVYPASQRARDVAEALGRHQRGLGVQLLLGRRVAALDVRDGTLGGVVVDNGESLAAPCVVLACGGRSWPSLGGTGGGYDLARQAGHTVTALTPALVPLVAREPWVASLAGVSLADARVRIALSGQPKAGVRGDVLFTHRGLSGPAVLDLSGDVAQRLARGRDVPLEIEPIAGMDRRRWDVEILAWRSGQGRRQVGTLLQQRLPRSLADALCELAGVRPQTVAAELPAGGRDALAALLGGLALNVAGTEGFEKAFVTRGGVKLKEVAPDTLESRVLGGLYIVGELLDLDGPTGGYNLQWAFASGHAAGRAAGGRQPV